MIGARSLVQSLPSKVVQDASSSCGISAEDGKIPQDFLRHRSLRLLRTIWNISNGDIAGAHEIMRGTIFGLEPQCTIFLDRLTASHLHFARVEARDRQQTFDNS